MRRIIWKRAAAEMANKRGQVAIAQFQPLAPDGSTIATRQLQRKEEKTQKRIGENVANNRWGKVAVDPRQQSIILPFPAADY